MKQQPNQLWYDKKEPITQIQILKTIALNGFQSKTILTQKLDSKITTIDTIVGKMNDTNHGLIQIHRKEQQANKKASHIMFSLTEKGIKILLENQYEESGKPYLEPKELITFISRFKNDYIDQKPVKDFPNWKPSKLNEKDIFNIYYYSNPEMKLILAKEYEKYNSKLGGLVNKIKEAKEKLDMLEKELPTMLYESCVNPAHLQQIPRVDNYQRSSSWRKSHCIHGHKMTQDNTYLSKNNCRGCKICRRNQGFRYRKRNET